MGLEQRFCINRCLCQRWVAKEQGLARKLPQLARVQLSCAEPANPIRELRHELNDPQARTNDFFRLQTRVTESERFEGAWCEKKRFTLELLEPVVVAAYVEELGHRLAKPTVKQHLAAIRMLFDYLVVGQIIPMNPASSARGPKYVVKRGKTAVLSAEETRRLFDSIDTATLIGLRDRALIAVMVFSFARVSAVVCMNVEDFFPNGKRSWFRLQEKGGKHHEVPAHHNAEAYLDAYLTAAGISADKKTPLFRTAARRTGRLTPRRLHRTDALRMIKRRARAAGLPVPSIACGILLRRKLSQTRRAVVIGHRPRVPMRGK